MLTFIRFDAMCLLQDTPSVFVSLPGFQCPAQFETMFVGRFQLTTARVRLRRPQPVWRSSTANLAKTFEP